MRELGLPCIIAAAAMILASQSFAQNREAEIERSARRPSVGQEQTRPRIPPVSPVFETERSSCTYRGGPKSGSWSCQ
jgi:hypothetical protein